MEKFTAAQNEENELQCLAPNKTAPYCNTVTQHLMEYHKRSEEDCKRLRTTATATLDGFFWKL